MTPARLLWLVAASLALFWLPLLALGVRVL